MESQVENIDNFLGAIQDKTNVKGYTHDFYNYPARFSPLFVRESIKTFTKPGDLIIDPFVGGGTTLVEAKILGRNSIGLDISSLATFIAKTKTAVISPKELLLIRSWTSLHVETLNCHLPINQSEWEESPYWRNMSGKATWPIKKIIDQFLFLLDESILSNKLQNFLRCSVLKTGQWALDNKKVIPSANDFRKKLIENVDVMCKGAMEFYSSLQADSYKAHTTCINRPSQEIDQIKLIKNQQAPALILTSPPYPGVHIVYHRWQIQGRKETPAPFWIANSLDGHGLTHYAMGGRKQKGLEDYFNNIYKTFSAVRNICSAETIVIQMLAFSSIEWQLPKYLDTMIKAGFREVQLTEERIWRNVPNRKWYADVKGKTDSSNEIVLFHKLID